MSYQMLDEKFNSIHQPFFCKDYFNEMFGSIFLGRDKSIYGFSWKSEQSKDLLLKDRLKVALVAENQSTLFNMKLDHMREPLEKLLHSLETKLGFAKSRVLMFNNDLVVMVDFSKEWVQKPYLLSFFMMCLRIGYLYKHDNAFDFFNMLVWKQYNIPVDKLTSHTTADIFSFTNNKNSLDNLVKILNGEMLPQKWTDYSTKDTGTLHNSAGFVNYKQQ